MLRARAAISGVRRASECGVQSVARATAAARSASRGPYDIGRVDAEVEEQLGEGGVRVVAIRVAQDGPSPAGGGPVPRRTGRGLPGRPPQLVFNCPSRSGMASAAAGPRARSVLQTSFNNPKSRSGRSGSLGREKNARRRDAGRADSPAFARPRTAWRGTCSRGSSSSPISRATPSSPSAQRLGGPVEYCRTASPRSGMAAAARGPSCIRASVGPLLS